MQDLSLHGRWMFDFLFWISHGKVPRSSGLFLFFRRLNGSHDERKDTSCKRFIPERMQRGLQIVFQAA